MNTVDTDQMGEEGGLRKNHSTNAELKITFKGSKVVI
jgi:hypothetical protein